MAEPIKVNSSPVPAQIWAGLRQVVPPVVAFLIGRHYIPDDVATLILAIAAGIGVPIAFGQYSTRAQAQTLAAVATNPAVPDSVITTKD